MLDIAAAGAAAYYGLKALGRLLRQEPAPLPIPIPEPPPPLVPLRPVEAWNPLFQRERGAIVTTQSAVNSFFARRAGPLYELAGVLWPVRKYLNKLTFVTGKPGSGKTTMAKLVMQSQAGLFEHLERLRWCVIDPTNAYLPYLYQILPRHVEILRASPQDEDGAAWDIAKDITNQTLNQALQAGLFPDALLQKANDPFWYTKGREVSEGLVSVYHFLGSRWEFCDIVIPLKYPQFLRPVLRQCPQTRGMVKHDLVGRLGRDIVATSSSVVNKMATAAAMWRRAKRKFSLKDFLESRSVLHFAFTPDLAPGLSGVANALTYVMILLALKRNEEYNHTILFADESRYLADITGIDDLAARGRGSGLGAHILAQGTPGLVAKWGENRVRELLDLICTWVTFAAGPETARAFSNAVGQYEGIQTSWGNSHTSSHSATYSTNSGGSYNSNSGSTSNWGSSYSSTSGSSSTYSESFQLVVKDAILPGEVTNLRLADADDDLLEGYAFNPDVGAFYFETDFLRYFSGLDQPPFWEMPFRPDEHQKLLPWTVEDCQRLNLELTPDLMKALRITWGDTGGVL